MTGRLEDRLRRLSAKGRQAAEPSLGSIWHEIAAEPLAGDDPLALHLAAQFLMGEELTAAACARLRHRVPLAEARECLALQTEDEERHGALYRRYLGGRRPAESGNALLGMVSERILAWQGPPEAIMLALHVILEGEALALQETARRFTACPRFAALSHVIARDEARHVAFGDHYLRTVLPQLTADERREIFVWLRRLWFESLERLPQSMTLPGIARPFIRHWSRRRWGHWQDHLLELGLLLPANEATQDDPVRPR